MNVKHLLSCLFLLSVCVSYGQPVNKGKLDSLFNGLANNKLGMGSIAIVQNDKLVYAKAFGDAVVDFYVHTARLEAQAFNDAVTDWERVRYFERI